MKKCQNCGGMFPPKRKEQEYCSRSCASVKKGQARRGQKTGARKNWEYKKNLDKDGYVRVYGLLHPYSEGRKMIPEHVVVMELSVGRRIKSIEVVHHKNGNRQDNRLVNLQLMTKSEHLQLHGRKSCVNRRRDKRGRFA